MRILTIVAAGLLTVVGAFAESPVPADEGAAEQEHKTASLASLKSARAALGDHAALAECLAVVRKAVRRVQGLGWNPDERAKWSDEALQLLKAAREQALMAREGKPPDVATDALSLKIAWTVVGGLFPEEFPAIEIQVLDRERHEAMERWYFGDKPPAGSGPNDLLAATWKWECEASLKSTRKENAWLLENVDPSKQPGVARLTSDAPWTDYRVTMEFTTDDKAFVLIQRQKEPAVPAIQHDVRLLILGGVDIRASEPSTLSFWVFGSRARIEKDGKSGRSQRCSFTGSRSGGISLRLPPSGKLTIRKLEVTVFDDGE
jgi:hypothetical protein